MENDITNARLNFFKVEKYEYKMSYTFDVRNIPRPHYCMGLVFEGKGIFNFADKSVSVNPEEIIFVPQGSTYISKWRGNPNIKYISIHYSFDFPGPFLHNNKLEIQKFKSSDSDELHDLYQTLYDEYTSSQGMFSSLSIFYDIMNRIYPYLKYSNIKEYDPRIENAIEYIEQHYSESISAEKLASLCNISTSYLYSCFKNSVGYSPNSYKNLIRIQHAELMLKENSQISIQEISDQLGFHSPIYFRKIFKQLMHITPTQYRKLSYDQL